MKKLVLSSLVSVMAFALVACGEKEPNREELANQKSHRYKEKSCLIKKQAGSELSEECKKILKE